MSQNEYDNDYLRNADDILGNYLSGKMEVIITESSTASNCIYVAPTEGPNNGFIGFIVTVADYTQAQSELIQYQVEGYKFDRSDAKMTISLHQNRLRNAKQRLIEEILKGNPNIVEFEQVISDLGIALNLQIDRNLQIYNKKTVEDNIHKKLKVLALESDYKGLYDKHKYMNKFYNATKHQKLPDNRLCEEKLSGPEGRLITIDYFETVRRVFRWYYKKYANGIPKWDELSPIKYSEYGIKYRFLYKRRWI